MRRLRMVDDCENELEDIGEEVFDSSQSLRKKRVVNYTKIKDTCLVLP
jgi:hypothetical protein